MTYNPFFPFKMSKDTSLHEKMQCGSLWDGAGRLLLIVLPALSGCADTAITRVVEYGTDSGIITGAQVGGCVVYQPRRLAGGRTSSPENVIKMIYRGDKCSVEVTE